MSPAADVACRRPWEAPLPFDDDLQVTPAYSGIVDPSELAVRPSDQLAPRIAGSDDVAATWTGPDGAEVTSTVVTGDTRDGAVAAECSPASGSLFRSAPPRSPAPRPTRPATRRTR